MYDEDLAPSLGLVLKVEGEPEALNRGGGFGGPIDSLSPISLIESGSTAGFAVENSSLFQTRLGPRV